MSQMELLVESGDAFSVRNIDVIEGISELFYISVWARSELSALDFETLIGKTAALTLTSGVIHGWSPLRRWKGVCERIEQVECEPGDSLYHVTLVPKLWLLTQRTNHRVFQHKTVQDIVKQLLEEWGIEHEWKIDPAAYPKLEIRIQYGESDFDFLSYLLEEAGIAYIFKDDPKKGTVLLLTDALSSAEERKIPLPFVHNANESSEIEHVTELRTTRTLRAGKVTLRDADFRRGPRSPVVGVTEPIPQRKSESKEGQGTKDDQAPKEDKLGIEDRFERYHFAPGSSLLEVDASKGGLSYPVGDKQGIARYQDEYEKRMATVELESRRAIATDIRFDTNAVDIAPGSIFRVLNHPRLHLLSDLKLLVLESTLEHTANEEIELRCRAIDSKVRYRPDRKTSRPVIRGVQSAVVVGPEKEEIFTDEFGRVKVQFFWDREGKFNENSSCWLRVAFGGAGPGFGRMAIPRVGHEVLVAFFEGNPDEPVIVGSAYNGTAPVPHQQPGHKTRTTWRTQSYPGGGGANEWMMDDAKGQELVYLLAERDHTRTVKQDHGTVIGRIDSTLVGDKLHWHIDGSGTGIEMVDNRITLTTGDASIVLNGSEISVSAKGTITLKSAGNDVVLQGGPMVKINVGNSAGVSKLKADAQAPKTAPTPERKRLPLLPGQKPCVKLGVNKKFKDAILLASQRTGMPPESIAAIMNAEAAKNRQGEWDPNSYNADSHAQGLTQFIPGTWNQMAKQKGTLLNERAQELGYVKAVTSKRGTSYQVVPGKEQELLDLRTDPELSIVSAAEYDSDNMKALDEAGLLPAGLSDDERAQYSYLTHHEGSGGAKQILNGKLTDARARKLFPGQVGKKKANELIAAEGGDAAGAYKKWLWGYTKQKVTPSKFRCSDEAVDGDESPEAKAAAANPPPKKSKK